MRAELWISVAISVIAIVLGLAALTVWLWDTNELLHVVQGIARPNFASRISYEMVAGAQRPLILAALAGFGMAAAAWIFGPKATKAILSDWKNLAERRKELPRAAWIIVPGGAAILLFNVLHHVDQPIRTDEATSFLRYGTRSVFAAVSWYSDTNNHILHSVLMRLSVLLFGDSAWAIRLPAAVAAILCIPAIYLAGLRLMGPTVAILACALFSGSVYTVDLATNGRGYPWVILFFLLSLSLVPDLLARRPGIWLLFVLFMGLGAWAVPIMLYPFAIVLATSAALLVMSRSRTVVLRQIPILGIGAFATGILVLVLYSPALLVLSLQQRAAPQGIEFVGEMNETQRVDGFLFHLSQGWAQWIFPLDGFSTIPVLVVAAWGAAVLMVRGGSGRALIIGTLLGFMTVFAVTGLAPLPWWSLGFLFPLLVLAIAVALGDVLTRLGIGSASSLLAISALFTALLWTAIGTANYPRRYPNIVGFWDAASIAKLVSRNDLHETAVFVRGYHLSPLRYYLRMRRGGERVQREDEIPGNPPTRFLHVDLFEDLATVTSDPHPDIAERLFRQGCRKTTVTALPRSTLSLFECAED